MCLLGEEGGIIVFFIVLYWLGKMLILILLYREIKGGPHNWAGEPIGEAKGWVEWE